MLERHGKLSGTGSKLINSSAFGRVGRDVRAWARGSSSTAAQGGGGKAAQDGTRARCPKKQQQKKVLYVHVVLPARDPVRSERGAVGIVLEEARLAVGGPGVRHAAGSCRAQAGTVRVSKTAAHGGVGTSGWHGGWWVSSVVTQVACVGGEGPCLMNASALSALGRMARMARMAQPRAMRLAREVGGGGGALPIDKKEASSIEPRPAHDSSLGTAPPEGLRGTTSVLHSRRANMRWWLVACRGAAISNSCNRVPHPQQSPASAAWGSWKCAPP